MKSLHCPKCGELVFGTKRFVCSQCRHEFRRPQIVNAHRAVLVVTILILSVLATWLAFIVIATLVY